MYYQVSAEGDVLVFKATSLDQAKAEFSKRFGVVPDGFLNWEEVEHKPEFDDPESIVDCCVDG
jgi:hypothetical protein